MKHLFSGLALILLILSVGVTALAANISVFRDEVAILQNFRCSLREAIQNANDDARTNQDCPAGNGADTITLANNTIFTLPDAPAAFDTDGLNGLPSITSEIIINGNGSTIERDGALVCQPNATANDGEFRVMHVGAGGDLTLNDLTIKNGCPDNFVPPTALHGGGLFNAGALAINGSTLTQNTATGAGGGIFNDVTGTLTITDSTFTSNAAVNASGGGIENLGEATIIGSAFSMNAAQQGLGGAISNESGTALMIENSDFTQNSADSSGGGLFNFDAMATIKTSTFSKNTAGGSGGGVYNFFNADLTIERSTFVGNTAAAGGGAIKNEQNSTLKLINSTLSGNVADLNGGGLLNTAGSTMMLENSTLFANTAANLGGGIRNEATIDIKNSIVAGSKNGDCSDTGAFTDFGQDFDTDGTCSAIDTFFVQVTLEELGLGPLADNGGPTQTHALAPDSVAIDAAPDCTQVDLTPIDEDQRGRVRAFPAGGNCDAGAFEFGYRPLGEAVRGTQSFTLPVSCGEDRTDVTIGATGITTIDEYGTVIDVHFPQKRLLGLFPMQATADVVMTLSLSDPAGFLQPGGLTLPVRSELASGDVFRLGCAEIKTFPTHTDANGQIDQLVNDLIAEASIFHGLLTLETDQRDLRVFVTTSKRTLRCHNLLGTLDCFEGGVTQEREEVFPNNVSISRNEVFIQALDVKAKVLSTARAIEFRAQTAAVESLSVEVYTLDGKMVFAGRAAGHALVWPLRDRSGRPVANGVYLYVIIAKEGNGRHLKSGVQRLAVLR